MSYPIRYSAAGTKIVETDPAGPLVEYIDYAILKAELTNCKSEADQLKAEVERLTDENVLIRMERMQDETGKRITYADYAELKAEVERLRASSFVTAVPVEQYERVIKAGDAMSNILIGRITSYEIGHAIDQWDAAREGKPSV